MSLSGLHAVTSRFLSTPRPEVLCVRGAWGIGKTHAWKRAIDHARARALPLGSYAYVSLFGVNSLDELKQAIFDCSVVGKSAGLEANFETFEEIINAIKGFGKSIARTAGTVAAHTGITSRVLGNVAPALFFSVRDRIICIDDLERRGEKLKVGEILGLISMLKEQRGCKIALLLNDEAISVDERRDFDAYLEKVVDVSFRFDPSPEDSAQVAFPNRSGMYAKTAERCIRLGIKNIRILKKISSFVEEIAPSLSDFDERLLDQAVSTIVFLCWVIFDPTNAPDLKYLKERTDWDAFLEERRKKLTPQAQGWEIILQDYGFGHIDDLDQALLEGIQNGYFDRDQVSGIAGNLHASIVAKNNEEAFHTAWAPYHDSFDIDQDKFLDDLSEAFKERVGHISPINVEGTNKLFRDLGRAAQAAELLQFYIRNVSDPKLVDLDEYFWAAEIKDPAVIEAFRTRVTELTPSRDPRATLDELAESGQYNPEDLQIALLSSSALETIFRTMRGRRHRKILKWFYDLDGLTLGDAANDVLKEKISAAGRKALSAIATGSEINRRQVASILKRSA